MKRDLFSFLSTVSNLIFISWNNPRFLFIEYLHFSVENPVFSSLTILFCSTFLQIMAHSLLVCLPILLGDIEMMNVGVATIWRPLKLNAEANFYQFCWRHVTDWMLCNAYSTHAITYNYEHLISSNFLEMQGVYQKFIPETRSLIVKPLVSNIHSFI